MEETDINKNEINKKSIMRPKTSKKMSTSEKKGKHMSVSINTNNSIFKSTNLGKNKNQNNKIFSKFDFNNDYLKQEEKAFKIRLKNLNNINLLENKDKVDTLYKWENLFNNMIPVRSYISLEKNKLDKEGIGNEKITVNIKDYNSPILLVDLPEEQMNLFFKRRNSQNHISTSSEKKYHNIRPVSMYVPREENSCFYFSDAFSDYYKEDFKSFCEKIPMLKAKLKINPNKLKKEIYKTNKDLINKYRILEEKKKIENEGFNEQDLIIAGKRNNPMPLIKSVYFQKYKSTFDFDMNKDDLIDNKNKGRNSLDMKIGNKGNNLGKSLFLSYYDINDPSLSLFKENTNLNFKNLKNNIFQNYYSNGRNLEIFKSSALSSKKSQDSKKNTISKETPKNPFNIKAQIPKAKLNVLNTKSNKKNNSKKMRNIKYSSKMNFKAVLNSDNLFKEEYKPSQSFPLKTSSNVGNISYDRIKTLIKERHFLNMFKFNYQTETQSTIPTSTEKTSKSDLELILDSKKIKPKKNWTLFDSIYSKNKKNLKTYFRYDKNGNLIKKDKNKYNVIYLNKCIKTNYDKGMINMKTNFDINCFFSINTFNKGYAHLKKKKNKKENKKEEKDKIELFAINNKINF